MQIQVIVVSGALGTVKCDESATVRDLRLKIEQLGGPVAPAQRLFLDRRGLPP